MKLKDIIWSVLGLVVLVFLVQTCVSNKRTNDLYMQNLTRTDSLLREYRDSQMVMREFMGKAVTQEMLKNSLDPAMVELRAVIVGLGYRVKDVEAIMKLSLISNGQLQGQLQPLLGVLDSLAGDTLNFTNTVDWDGIFKGLTKRYSVEFSTPNLSASGKFDISTGKLYEGKYKYQNELLVVSSWKRRLLRADYPVLAVQSNDPNADIRLSSYQIDPPRNLFDISLQLGYGVVVDGLSVKNAPYFGLGISKKLFSVNRK